MKRLLWSLSIISALWIWSCGGEGGERTPATKPMSSRMAKGLDLLQTNCFACHSPTAGQESRLAPPMIAIKKHYIGANTSEEDFADDLIAFMKNPTKEKAKMRGAVERFGVMPKMTFPEEQLRTIAHYIYHAELQRPGWFKKHYEEEHGKDVGDATEENNPMEQGRAYAMATKSVLGKNLLGAIQQKGTTGALSFCSERAIPLTDSMAQQQGVLIKRVSDQPRNPNNAANEKELAYIQAAKTSLKEGKEIQPKITAVGEKLLGYYPITTNDMCMQCHGKPKEQILPETMAKIKERYPNDKATGYAPGQLRGIWVVEMEP